MAALGKSVAYYRKPRSFSLNATQKVIYDGVTTRASRLQVSLQAPYRASLRTTFLDDKGRPITTGVVRLMDAKSLYLSRSGVWPNVRAIGATREQRADGLKEVFNDVPGIAISVVLMALGYDPTSDSNIKSVRYRETRENGKKRKSVTVVRKTPADATGITAELRLNPRSYAVEKVVFYLEVGGKPGKIVTEIGSPIPNWKGSQSATDAAIYNWKTLAPEIPLAPPKPKTKISIDAKARAVFARAVKLYGETKGLKARWKSRDENGKTLAGSLDFDRAGRLRLAGTELIQPLVVLDGKNRWSLDDIYDTDESSIRVHSRAESEPDEVYFEMQTAPGIAGALGTLLSRVNSLEADVLRTESENWGLSEFRAVLLPPQPLNGRACELVRISRFQAMNPEAENEIQKVIQQTYWFSRENGALLRFQEGLAGDGIKVAPSDWQITEQKFNPQFAPDTFKFTPPKGAVLQEN